MLRAVPQGRAHQLLIPCSTVGPESIRMRDIIQIEQAIVRKTYVCIYTYMHAITSNEKRGHTFEREQGSAVWKGLEGGML